MNERILTPLLASKEKRIGTLVIDTIGFYAFSYLIGIVLGLLALIGFDWPLMYLSQLGVLGNWVLTIVVFLLYFTVFEAITQKTLGKFIFKTKVVMEDGSRPKASDIFLRSLCRLIPFEAFSYLNDIGRGWHDSLSETYVVDDQKFDNKIKINEDLEQLGKGNEDYFSDFQIK